ncbi:MAG: hypothetical protein ACOVLB_00090 [Candidatus Nanopelagicus sp.]
MTPTLFNQSKNLFLLHTPGCGGNHLANMLSLHPEFEHRFESDDYEAEMMQRYKDNVPYGVFHFGVLENLQIAELDTNRQKIIECTKKYIFCSHVEEYFYSSEYVKGPSRLEGFDNRFFILFTIPKTNELLLKRIANNSYWYTAKRAPGYIAMDAESYEIADSINCGIPENSIFQLDSDLFYTIEGFDYLQDKLTEYFGIELPEICRNLHTTYISIQELEQEMFDNN